MARPPMIWHSDGTSRPVKREPEPPTAPPRPLWYSKYAKFKPKRGRKVAPPQPPAPVAPVPDRPNSLAAKISREGRPRAWPVRGDYLLTDE